MTKAPKTRHMSIKNQKGVGLIEVLVALIILSVGLLGIASLYVTTLQAKTTSLSRMKAVYLAQDMADRMRANPSAIMRANPSAIESTGYNLTLDTGISPDPSNPSCPAPNQCTDVEIAEIDKYQWTKMITDTVNGTGLPGDVQREIEVIEEATPYVPAGDGMAAQIAHPSKTKIYLKWTEPNTGNAPLTYTLWVQI